MRVFRRALILSAACLTGTANAENDIPDMRGTWTGPANGVFIASPGPPREAHYASTEITLVVDKQQDRSFSGIVKTPDNTKPMVGVIGWNGDIWWSEPGGFVEGRLKDADTIQGCYVRVSAYSQLAACEELKRQE